MIWILISFTVGCIIGVIITIIITNYHRKNKENEENRIIYDY